MSRRRRDWQGTDLSRAWQTFLMGPRPPSVRWPRSWEQRRRSSSAEHSDSKTRPQHSAPKPRQPTRGYTHRPSKAIGASTSMQSGRPCCGSTSTSDSSPGCRGFVERGQHRCGQFEDHACRSQGAPVGERLDAGLKFIDRAKKRLGSADQDVIKAQEARAARETELSEGLANLQRLRSEATSAAPVPPVGVCGVADAGSEG